MLSWICGRASGRASGFSRGESGQLVHAAYREPSFGYGYGALFSTVADLHRLNRALARNTLLSAEATRLMLQPRRKTPWGNHYGLGWFLDDWNDRPFAAALGSTAGFVGTMRHFLEEDVVLVVLLDQDFMLHEELYDRLSAIALGRPWTPVLSSARFR